MKRGENAPHKFESLTELHRALGLEKPLHPLVSIVNNMDNKILPNKLPVPFILNFYKITYQPNLHGKFKIGQHFYDFEEGGLFFVSPNQLKFTDRNNGDHSGYILFIHPDFMRPYDLSKKIKQYNFFSYTANEALHLSDNEKETIISILKMIEMEINSRIDDFSQDVIISQIELLLNYANRFYKRQFITRRVANNDLLQKVEEIVNTYFNDGDSLNRGILTVQYLAEKNKHVFQLFK